MTRRMMIVMSILIPLHVFAQNTQTLINFDTFEDQLKDSYPIDNQLKIEKGVPYVEIGSEMFLLDNWRVTLQKYAAENPIAKKESYTKKVSSPEKGTVLGVRVHYPTWPNDCYALIHPQFPILPFKITGEYMNINQGVVRNIDSIKSFSMWVCGRNFPFTMGVRVKDLKNKLSEFPLGSLMYVGWRYLTYNNSLYSDRAVDNVAKAHRLYPSEVPLIRFDSIAIYRPGNYEGGDFIGYFGSAEISFTPYEIETTLDIDDESIWGLVAKEQKRKALAISSPLYEEINQYELAQKRMDIMNKNPQATPDNNTETTQSDDTVGTN